PSECPAGSQSPHHIQPGVVTALKRRLVAAIENGKRAQRRGEIKTLSDLRPVEFGRRDTDHFERTALHEEARTNGVEVPAEFTLPEWVTQNDARAGAASEVVFRAQQPSGSGRDSERGEELAGHRKDSDLACLGALPQPHGCISA